MAANMLFDIDWQGANQLGEKMPNRPSLSIFILPPSMEELKSRLAAPAPRIRPRRSTSGWPMRAKEIAHWQEYDYVVVN